jgi:hypothetical protein
MNHLILMFHLNLKYPKNRLFLTNHLIQMFLMILMYHLIQMFLKNLRYHLNLNFH